MKRFIGLFVIGMMVLLTVSPFARADTIEGFDTYQAGYAGTNLPSTWTFSTDNAACWQTPTNAPATGVETLPNAQQPSVTAETSKPNVFEFSFNANCFGVATSASISTEVNVTSSVWFM